MLVVSQPSWAWRPGASLPRVALNGGLQEHVCLFSLQAQAFLQKGQLHFCSSQPRASADCFVQFHIPECIKVPETHLAWLLLTLPFLSPLPHGMSRVLPTSDRWEVGVSNSSSGVLKMHHLLRVPRT